MTDKKNNTKPIPQPPRVPLLGNLHQLAMAGVKQQLLKKWSRVASDEPVDVVADMANLTLRG